MRKLQVRILRIIGDIGDPLFSHIAKRLGYATDSDVLRCALKALVVAGLVRTKEDEIDHDWAYLLTESGHRALEHAERTGGELQEPLAEITVRDSASPKDVFLRCELRRMTARAAADAAAEQFGLPKGLDYRLQNRSGDVLDPTLTLAENGVADGHMLELAAVGHSV